MQATNKQEWTLAQELSAYSVHTTQFNIDKGNLIKESLAIKNITGGRFNPGSWATPLYLIADTEEQHQQIQELLDYSGLEWSFVHKVQAENAG